MGKVVILSTGGTIAMDQTASSSHPVPSLTGRDFEQQLASHFPTDIEILAEDIINIPSAHISLETLQEICQKAQGHSSNPDVAGMVVTHGTDTMEESAYFAHLCYSGSQPVVYTGAMRSANETGYDGLRNLISALRVASFPRGQGTRRADGDERTGSFCRRGEKVSHPEGGRISVASLWSDR